MAGEIGMNTVAAPVVPAELASPVYGAYISVGKIKSPPSIGGLFTYGGLRRNRTTDTRIFSLLSKCIKSII